MLNTNKILENKNYRINLSDFVTLEIWALPLRRWVS